MTVTDLRAGLETVAGDEHVREAVPADAVDGVQPRWVVEPGTVEEASAIMRLAHEQGLAVTPRGGGSKLGWGNPPERLDLILSTARLNGVLEHAAGDLVVRVQAGARLDDVQHELGRAGQWLALDPLEESATIGGIMSANASGSRRLRYGTVRDLVIGMTYVLPDGTVARAGSKVVKNVAGYDLCKLFTGALGTLGLVVEVILRLHPLPHASRTLLLCQKGGDPETLGARVQSIVNSGIVPSALDFTWSPSDTALALRIDGVAPGVEAQATLATELLEMHGGSVQDAQDEQEVWRRGGLLWPEGAADARAAWLKIADLPANLPRVLHDAVDLAGRQDLVFHIRGHAASGITILDVGPVANGADSELTRRQVGFVRALRDRVTARGGSVVIRDAPLSVKQALDVWGDGGSALPLMRTVKTMFDPGRVMNPGRFLGGM